MSAEQNTIFKSLNLRDFNSMSVDFKTAVINSQGRLAARALFRLSLKK